LNRDIRRILIVRTDRIGDVILTLPMAQVLKEHFPSLHVSMLIRQYTRELVEGNRCVDEVLYYDDHDRPVRFWKMVSRLRTGAFDAVVLTYPRFRLALLTMLAGIHVRIGTGYRWYSFLLTTRVFEHRKDARKHELEYNLDLLRAIDPAIEIAHARPVLTVDDRSRAVVESVLGSRGVSDRDRIVVLHPGSGGSARDWAPVRFRELAGRLAASPEVKVVVTGLEREKELAESVCGNEHNVISVAGLFTLREMAALASKAKVFVSNSTGPIHIAAAVGAHVVGLYPQVTALSPARWSPVTPRKVIITPRGKPVDCRTCVQRNDSSCECMDSITVDEVFDAVTEVLGQQ
jgi:heptosyltransferase III